MISYLTKLPLKPITCQQFHQLLSQYHQIDALATKALSYHSNGWIINKGNILAYHLEDEGIYEYIYSEDTHELYVSVDTEHNKIPGLIETLIRDNYLEKDGNLAIQGTVHVLESAQAIETKYLPFVYLDERMSTDTILDELSSRLKGMVHIICGDDKIDTDMMNAYHMESSSFAWLFNGDYFNFSRLKKENQEEFVERVCDRMQSYVTKRVFEYPFRINELYQQALSELIHTLINQEEEILNSYDLKISRLENRKQNILARIEQLNQQMNKMNAQILYYEMMLESKQETPILFKGEEKELYKAEQKDMILYLVENELKTERDPERIALIKAILKDNPKDGTRDYLLGEIESILGKSQFLTDYMKSQLRKLGIDFERTIKHPDGAFFDDDRYPLVFSSSPSDLHANDKNYRYVRNHCF